MTVTTTYGYKKPQTGDDGSEFFPALEETIDLLDAHDHDGANSKKLTATSSEGFIQNVVPAWTEIGTGNAEFRQLVTLPAALVTAGATFDKIDFQLRSDAGEVLYLECVKNTATSFYVYSNDDALDLTVVYTT